MLLNLRQAPPGEDCRAMKGKIYLTIGLLLLLSSTLVKSSQIQEKAITEAERFGQNQNQKNLESIKNFITDAFISNH